MSHLLRARGLQGLLLAGTSRTSRNLYDLSLRFKRPPPARFFSSLPRIRGDVLESHGYGTSQTTDVKLLNQQLADSVNKENYAGAERLRLHLVSEFAVIEPNPIYERAALAQIRWPHKQDLQAFLTWLYLVPDNEYPSQVENGPLTKTRNTLFRTGNPARNLLLITEFSLACAAKGYGHLVWDDLVSLMSRFQHPDRAVAFFRSFEIALLEYHSKYHSGSVEETASRQRYLLIMLCCEAGWLEEAVQVVLESSTHRILGACERLIDLLRARNDLANVALVETVRDRQRHADSTSVAAGSLPPKSSISQLIGGLFDLPSERLKAVQPSSSSIFYSTRTVIDGTRSPRSRSWIATQLRGLKRALVQRSLTVFHPRGSTLHQLMAHYEACQGHSRGLLTLRKRAISASDPSSYAWLCKEMYYLHEQRKFADIIAVFGANFHDAFLPPHPWHVLRDAATPTEPWRTVHAVPKKMQISNADSWIIWNALVRLSATPPYSSPLPLLEDLHHSAVHFSSKLTDRQFRAFPTSYTAVFRSIVWAYGELSEIDKAVAAAGDLSLIGKLDMSTVGVFDELAGVHARSGNVPAATQLLGSLEELGPRLATYGVMMDGYIRAGLVDEAVKLEVRMKQKCDYVPGRNWRMDATLKALRAVEDTLVPETA